MDQSSRYHCELRYQLDMADVRLSNLLKDGWHHYVDADIEAALDWRHMLIEELARVQLKEWDHG